MLHQNNTCPIMAGGCHVVMTENVVIKGDNMKRRCPTTSLCRGGVQNYFRPCSLFVSAFPARTGGFDSFTLATPARSEGARDRMVATQQPGRATFVETRGLTSGRKPAAISRGYIAGTRIRGCQTRRKHLRWRSAAGASGSRAASASPPAAISNTFSNPKAE